MKRYTVAVLLIGALACTDSNGPAMHQFSILPAVDTVAAGVSVRFVAQRQDSTVDAWQLSDSSAARIDSSGNGWVLVHTLAAGTVTITATRLGDSGQATLVILPPPPPPPSKLGISPALDTIKVGELVTFKASITPQLHDTLQWLSSDSSLVPVPHYDQCSPDVQVVSDSTTCFAWFVGRATGTVTITATHHGDTAHATLVVRETKVGEWEAIDLSLIDSGATSSTAINDKGVIVGLVGQYSGGRGFVYQDGVIRQLPASGDGDWPLAIGPTGTIAGFITDGPWHDQNVVEVWESPNAAPRILPHGTHEYPGVIGVNERGDVLITMDKYKPGFYQDHRAVIWRDGAYVDLGDLADSSIADPWTYANAWNNSGQVVGRSQVRDPKVVDSYLHLYHPYLWENGVMRDLGVLAPLPCPAPNSAIDCSWGEAVDINAHGVVVGNSAGADGKTRAFMWENGVMRDLGVSPGRTTEALAINDRGQVLGTIDDRTTFVWDNGQTQIIPAEFSPRKLGPNGEVLLRGYRGLASHVFIWQAGQVSDLGEGEAQAINSRGEVVGTSGDRAMLWRKKQSP
jgi:probable HAF family extracellular repeat protein